MMEYSFKILKGQLFLNKEDIERILEQKLPLLCVPFQQVLSTLVYTLEDHSDTYMNYDRLEQLIKASHSDADLLLVWSPSGILEGLRVHDGMITHCNTVVTLEPTDE